MLIKPKNFFVTGPPRSGKSSLILEIIKELQAHRIGLRGVVCPEIRRDNRRWGFKLKVIPEGDERILASVEIRSPFRVSKYGVDISVLDNFAAKAILDAAQDPSILVIVIDEIGKMELLSKRFRQAVKVALNSEKFVLGVMGRIRDPLVNEIRHRRDTAVFSLFFNTPPTQRQRIKKIILKNILQTP